MQIYAWKANNKGNTLQQTKWTRDKI